MKTPHPDMTQPKSPILKRSVMIAGHRTSLSLEEPFWRLLKARAKGEGLSAGALIAHIDGNRQGANLSAAIRIHLVEWLLEEGRISLE